MRLSPAASASGWWIVAASLSMLSSAACVSPDTFFRDGDDAGAAGQIGSGSGGNGTNPGLGGSGPGGSGQGGSGTGGSVTTGGGGTTGAGGRTGMGGSGMGGNVISTSANLTDNFETGNVADRYYWDSDSGSMLNPSGTPCGDWAVVADGATNHVFSQRKNCSGSNPSWAAGGNSTAWTDMRLQAKVRFDTGATTSTKITLGVRFTTDRSQYFIEYTNNGKIKIRSKTDSSTSDVATTSSAMQVPVTTGQWVTIGLAVSGTTLNAYLGENRAAAAVLTGTATELTVGGIGMGVSGGPASFDDILVTPP